MRRDGGRDGAVGTGAQQRQQHAQQRRLLRLLEHPAQAAEQPRQRGRGERDAAAALARQLPKALVRGREEERPAARAAARRLGEAACALRRVRHPREEAAQLWLLRGAQRAQHEWHLPAHVLLRLAQERLEALQKNGKVMLHKLRARQRRHPVQNHGRVRG